jgi:hypoxanthine phosphoribosyltransferase
MNVFKFNNNRIGAMNNSLNLRIDTAESMQSLEKILDQWNKDLKKTKTIPKHKKPKQEKEKERKVTIIDESKELK